MYFPVLKQLGIRFLLTKFGQSGKVDYDEEADISILIFMD